MDCIQKQNIIGNFSPEEHFCLHVKDDSMKNAGIPNGAIITAHRQDEAESGDIVVLAVGDNKALIRKYTMNDNGDIALTPANDNFPPTVVLRGQNPNIIGIVVEVRINLGKVANG